MNVMSTVLSFIFKVNDRKDSFFKLQLSKYSITIC